MPVKDRKSHCLVAEDLTRQLKRKCLAFEDQALLIMEKMQNPFLIKQAISTTKILNHKRWSL
jgi:hypothetical protein